PGLGQRCVDHPLVAELVEEPLRHPEDPAPRRDVLPEHHDAIVRRHLVVQGVVGCGDNVLLGPSPSCSKNTCRSSVDGSGSAAFHAASICASTSALVSAHTAPIAAPPSPPSSGAR